MTFFFWVLGARIRREGEGAGGKPKLRGESLKNLRDACQACYRGLMKVDSVPRPANRKTV